MNKFSSEICSIKVSKSVLSSVHLSVQLLKTVYCQFDIFRTIKPKGLVQRLVSQEIYLVDRCTLQVDLTSTQIHLLGRSIFQVDPTFEHIYLSSRCIFRSILSLFFLFFRQMSLTIIEVNTKLRQNDFCKNRISSSQQSSRIRIF